MTHDKNDFLSGICFGKTIACSFFSAKGEGDMPIYFIVSGEISVYLVKIKVVSITSELISYHFTND